MYNTLRLLLIILVTVSAFAQKTAKPPVSPPQSNITLPVQKAEAIWTRNIFDHPHLKLAPKEIFVLAFAKDNQIVVRTSADGYIWDWGNFPVSATSTQPPANAHAPFYGVGVSATSTHLYTVTFDQPQGFGDVWGLGWSIWDSTPVIRPLPTKPKSGPAVLDVGYPERLLCLTGDDRKVGAFVYDDSTRQTSRVTLPSASNSGVWARPAIVQKTDGTILLGWVSDDFMTSVGRKTASGFTFDAPVLTGDTGGDFLVSGPSLAADSTYFYSALMEKQTNSWYMAIYRSPDGKKWTKFAQPIRANNLTKIAIAARSNGTLLATALMNNDREYAERQVSICERSSPQDTCMWHALPPSQVFGTDASDRDYALITTTSP